MSQPSSSPETEQETAVTVEQRGHVLLVGLNRPAKRNAFDLAMTDMAELFDSEDGREGVRSFIDRREARFVGR